MLHLFDTMYGDCKTTNSNCSLGVITTSEKRFAQTTTCIKVDCISKFKAIVTFYMTVFSSSRSNCVFRWVRVGINIWIGIIRPLVESTSIASELKSRSGSVVVYGSPDEQRQMFSSIENK